MLPRVKIGQTSGPSAELRFPGLLLNMFSILYKARHKISTSFAASFRLYDIDKHLIHAEVTIMGFKVSLNVPRGGLPAGRENIHRKKKKKLCFSKNAVSHCHTLICTA